MSYQKKFFIRYMSLFLILLFLSSPYFRDFLTFVLSRISYFILSFFYPVVKMETGIFFSEIGHTFLIVEACLGISAYILFNMVFFGVETKKTTNLKIFLRSSLIFTLFNIVRIILLIILYVSVSPLLFEALHFVLYQGLTGFIAAGIVIYYYKKYKIKGYPFVTDLKMLLKIQRKLYKKDYHNKKHD